MSDFGIKLAQRAMDLFLNSPAGITDDDCPELMVESLFGEPEDDIDEEKCNVLRNVLSPGMGALITEEEKEALEAARFSREFVSALAGDDGAKAFRKRFEFLKSAVIDDKPHREDIKGCWRCVPYRVVYPNGRERIMSAVKELRDFGPNASDMIPALVDVIESAPDSEWALVKETALTIRSLEEQAGLRTLIDRLHIAKPDDRPSLIDGLMYYSLRTPMGSSEEVISVLEAMLHDSNPRSRLKAANMLMNIGPAASRALPSLMALLEDEDEHARGSAYWAIGALAPDSPEVAQVLVAGLEERNENVRQDIVRGLSYMRVNYRTIIPALVGIMKDSDDNLVHSAAMALGDIGVNRHGASRALVEAASDRVYFVRASAMESLGLIGHAGAWPMLVKAFENQEENAQVRKSAAVAMIWINPALAIRTIFDRLEEEPAAAETVEYALDYVCGGMSIEDWWGRTMFKLLSERAVGAGPESRAVIERTLLTM